MKQPTKAPRANIAGPKSSGTPKRIKKTRVELDLEARERKRQKKHSGNRSGARSNVESSNKKGQTQSQEKDPRLGSKVPVPLVVDSKVKAKPTTKPVAKTEAKPRLTPEEELSKLENDERLDALLDRLDNDEVLSKEDQAYVDLTLDRIDALMEQLGIELGDEEDDEEKEEKPEDILKLLKGGNPNDKF
ncbi:MULTISPECIES: Der GTPase-activating protein YihI [Yersinia]|uniref:Der GTPase-activating protein YihI n=1 Tax=Yersinia TaxID=629 RepID=UPI0005E9C154|nr:MULTISPECIES: Der GTPase-activating protein YihI [Yersinia]HEC1650400.1 Der GTPase-activating protein YihI [Yersinia enterocolitica]ATM88051.1 Der GTPase-activating protein YihI [Yersinia frederiksenii]MCB5318983.1 Der GTPase-activating protein YihI [Yersinia massiliensis]CFR29525.1 GTPase activator [Yersinia frederiksenii]CNL57718.1 GTPase activator [Yersinia frederiksenii]